MRLTEVCARLDDRLRTADYADVDASANGLQVGAPEATVEHVVFAVDAALATVERAVDLDGDLLVTHHGLVWDGLDRLTDRTYDRIRPLVRNDCALYVSHLPLDGHSELGNAAGLAAELDLREREPFGLHGGEPIGQRGSLPASMGIDTLTDNISTGLGVDEAAVQVLPFGPESVEDVAIVTGSGVDWLEDAIDAGADVFITGEGKQFAYHLAREAGIHVVLGGHYATETLGVQALASLLADWGLETTYVDHPTGL